jgi:hypothetical protein
MYVSIITIDTNNREMCAVPGTIENLNKILANAIPTTNSLFSFFANNNAESWAMELRGEMLALEQVAEPSAALPAAQTLIKKSLWDESSIDPRNHQWRTLALELVHWLSPQSSQAPATAQLEANFKAKLGQETKKINSTPKNIQMRGQVFYSQYNALGYKNKIEKIEEAAHHKAWKGFLDTCGINRPDDPAKDRPASP